MSTESLDLAALKELCEKATPEPWERYDDDIWQGDEHILALTAAHDVTADAEFIAAARTALPALIAEVEKTARDTLREVLASAPVQFWICPVEAHHHDYPEPPREIVRWIGDVAHCMEPGCGRTSADPVRPQETPRERVAQALHDWRCLRACKGYEYHSEETKNFYRNEADGVLPIVEEETKAMREQIEDERNTHARQEQLLAADREDARDALSALRDKVKALAGELLNPRHVDGAYEWAEKPDRDHARGRVHAQRQIGEKLLALVEEPQGGEDQ